MLTPSIALTALFSKSSLRLLENGLEAPHVVHQCRLEAMGADGCYAASHHYAAR